MMFETLPLYPRKGRAAVVLEIGMGSEVNGGPHAHCVHLTAPTVTALKQEMTFLHRIISVLHEKWSNRTELQFGAAFHFD
jgi:hypothetical protein